MFEGGLFFLLKGTFRGCSATFHTYVRVTYPAYRWIAHHPIGTEPTPPGLWKANLWAAGSHKKVHSRESSSCFFDISFFSTSAPPGISHRQPGLVGVLSTALAPHAVHLSTPDALSILQLNGERCSKPRSETRCAARRLSYAHQKYNFPLTYPAAPLSIEVYTLPMPTMGPASDPVDLCPCHINMHGRGCMAGHMRGGGESNSLFWFLQ